MTLDPRRIESIVSEVLERLEREPGTSRSESRALGVHPDLDTAVAAARSAFDAYDKVPLSTRAKVIAVIRDTL